MEKGYQARGSQSSGNSPPQRAVLIALLGVILVVASIAAIFAVPTIGRGAPWDGLPDETVQVTKFWPIAANNSQRFGYAPINHSVAARIVPKQLGIATDRIYVTAGSRLFAVNPDYGTNDWTSPIDFRDLTFSSPPYSDPNPLISADPVVDNFGRVDLAYRAWFWVYVGTSSGSVYAMNDTELSGFPPYPIRIGVVNGSITGVAVFSGDYYETFTKYDMVAVSTSSGSVYFWQVNESGHFGPKEFKVSLKPVRIAGQPMHGTGPYPLFSPAFYYTSTNRTRPYIYAGSEDGNLTALNIANISRPTTVAWAVRVAGDGDWTSAPVVRLVSFSQTTEGAVVFAATDEGRLWALNATTGIPELGWSGGREIGGPPPDNGRLTQPSLDTRSTKIYVGSSSGYVHAIDYLAQSPGGGSLTVRWSFRDPRHPAGSTYISASPSFYAGTTLFVVSNYDRGPPGPSPEDEGMLSAVNLYYEEGRRSWYVSFDSPIMDSVIAVTSQMGGLDKVYIGTSGGSVYSYSTVGLTISEPMKKCPDGSSVPLDVACPLEGLPTPLIAAPLAAIGGLLIALAAVKTGKRLPPSSQQQ